MYEGLRLRNALAQPAEVNVRKLLRFNLQRSPGARSENHPRLLLIRVLIWVFGEKKFAGLLSSFFVVLYAVRHEGELGQEFSESAREQVRPIRRRKRSAGLSRHSSRQCLSSGLGRG